MNNNHNKLYISVPKNAKIIEPEFTQEGILICPKSWEDGWRDDMKIKLVEELETNNQLVKNLMSSSFDVKEIKSEKDENGKESKTYKVSYDFYDLDYIDIDEYGYDDPGIEKNIHQSAYIESFIDELFDDIGYLGQEGDHYVYDDGEHKYQVEFDQDQNFDVEDNVEVEANRHYNSYEYGYEDEFIVDGFITVTGEITIKEL